MSATGKWIIWAIVIAVILGVGYWYFSNEAMAPENEIAPASVGDSSNAALDQDTAAIDAQLQALDSDTASIDAQLNDTPIE